jgi:ADP-ribose pyrophosphatase
MPGGQELEREIVRHGGSAVILPILESGGRRQIVFVENHRFSIGRTLLEIPAGTLEAGEDVSVCAGRELIEETGYRAARIERLAEFYPTPGMTDERMRLFIATGLTHVGQDLEDDESITVRLLDAAEAMRLATSGSLEDGKSILAITLAHARGLI